MKIIGLKAENIKRLKTVEIVPDGNTIIIGGQNSHGKSSCLDAIAYALGGKKLVPEKPIREGQDHARIEVYLNGETGTVLPYPVKVTRHFYSNGKSEVEIESSDGMKAPSPQTLLDTVCGAISFDPLAFARMNSKQQLETVKRLVGIDTNALDKERQNAYTIRTGLNRQLKDLEAAMRTKPYHQDIEDKGVDVSALTQELQRRMAVNQSNDQEKDKVRWKEAEVDRAQKQVTYQEGEVARITSALQSAKANANAATTTLQQSQKESSDFLDAAAKLVDEDCVEIQQQIQDASEINRKAEENRRHAQVIEDGKKIKAEADVLTKQIKRVDTDKKKMVQDAKWPIPGMGFSSSGVTLNDIPLDQAGQAATLHASVAIGMAANPTLKVLLVRDGSLLDDESLAMLTKSVEDEDYQLWLEMATRSESDPMAQRCAVVLVEGEDSAKAKDSSE